MKILITIAWRNIWRNRLRSLIVIGSIILGIWAGVYVSGFSYGLNIERTENAINENISHIQLHAKNWKQDPKLENWLPQSEKILSTLQQDKRVRAYSSRILVNGMVASAHYTSGVRIIGINPKTENELTGLAGKLDTGTYFQGKTRNPIMLGEALAQKLKVRLGSKVVLTFTDAGGDVLAGAFKVKGIYKALSKAQEKMLLYVQQEDLGQLVGQASAVHEVALLAQNPEEVESIASDLQNQFSASRVETWREIAPELSFADEILSKMLYLIIGIIMMALCFGIINTMMMAVLERRKELGVLMGVGMSKTRLFMMIILETLMLSLIGGPLGIFFGFLSIEITKRTGLDLSIYGEGLGNYGINTIIYPYVETSFYFGTGLLVMAVTLVAAVWPARHALKLNPVETIRTI